MRPVPPPDSTVITWPPVAVAADGRPLAGCHAGLCYTRDANDTFRLFVGGALHIDGNYYAGRGVPDTALKTQINLRRARLILAGEFMDKLQFVIMHEVGASALDNIQGTRQDFAAAVGQDPTASSARFSEVQAPKVTSRLQDAYINYRAHKVLNVQVGQFKVPFMMENRTSSNSTSLLEDSLALRNLGSPYGRDIGLMAWGNLDKSVLYYSAGVFLGDGINRANVDNRFDGAARVFVRPFAGGDSFLKGLHVGASATLGSRDPHRVGYDVWTMKTQGGWGFWGPTYTDSLKRVNHVIPAGKQEAVAAEFWLPLGRLDLRGEFVYARNETREAVDGYQLANTERFGTLSGWGYYAQAGYAIWGQPLLGGEPGNDAPRHLDFTKPQGSKTAKLLEAIVRWEQIKLDYRGSDRSGQADSSNLDGFIKVNALNLAANYWLGKNFRCTLSYAYYMFPGSEPKSASTPGGAVWNEEQRALAPGNALQKGVNDGGRDGAHALHEIAARFGMQF